MPDWMEGYPKEGKAKEAAKIGKDSEYQLGKEKAEQLEVLIDSGATSSFMHPRTAESLRLPLIDLPLPRTVTMLNGSSPQAGKIWKKANLTFSFDGKQHVSIAEEEEADQHPLEGVPSKYHQYAKVFGEEEFNKLPPHRHYDIGIELTKEGPLNSPLYSMTDAKSATLKDWLRDELKAGKIHDLMAQLRGAKVFTKLDLRWGYNNVRVKEGNEWKTAFFIQDLLDVCVIIYLDDILIYSKDDASHTQHVHEVLKRLMENQLFCKASKCTFHVTSVEYLGIIVSDKGFSLDKLKIQVVQDWPVPTKSRRTQWKWDVKEQEAFQGLKDAITNAPVLCHADPSKPYFLETDASGAALGSILSQRQEDGRLHPLGFLSESFKGAKQNYNTHDKELLAIIRSFKYWRIFLEGTLHPITVFTDHRNLEYWKESRTFNRRHAQWHLLLAGYNFQIVYQPGKQSGKPDALSRRSDHADIPPANQTMLPDPVFANVALVTPKKELQRQIKASLDQDKSLEEILQFLQTTRWQAIQADKDLRIGIKTYYWPGIRANTYWHPLELPSHPWQHVSYDMIVDLPKDGSNNSILVIVDSFTKYVILVECSKKLKAPELADLFLRHVWKRYGMPEKTVSDRGRKDWVKWLPMAEFAYNNAVHSSTGKTPFKALYGWEPSLTPSNVPTDVPEADDLATQMEAQWREIEAALQQSKTRMIAGETGEPLEFEIGEEAWLDAKNVKLKTLSPKLTKQRLDPSK
ncbi:hypothetical protein RHS01_04117 [Rhizoctonia solani]|uniref:Integrase catalytic domain-containing protein n=1 Tax=Rhizoctonia solani TaxID=456999 RepID=A0A8H7IE95_9AGAM|nr:hypothetical protein RHS01_04117 [Rhizoctonia solani]